MRFLMFHIIFLLLINKTLAQTTNYEIVCIGFYNVENLFDIKDDSLTYDEDFTPDGKLVWTEKRYQKKINNLSKVISEVGTNYTPHGVSILGLAEVENENVLNDLVSKPILKNRNYQIVHFDSPDQRGIDVALLYNPNYFKLSYKKKYFLKINTKKDRYKYTRDILLVAGELKNEKVFIIVNHWPSRSGGMKETQENRIAAAKLLNEIVLKIQNIDQDAKIIIMGDFNDDPTNISIKKHLNTSGKINKLEKNGIYNPWEKFDNKGYGTLAWDDRWNLFDQILITEPLVDKTKNFDNFSFYKAEIFNKPYLQQKEGRFKGYPFRTYGFGVYKSGFSDHFPVLIYLIKKHKK